MVENTSLTSITSTTTINYYYYYYYNYNYYYYYYYNHFYYYNYSKRKTTKFASGTTGTRFPDGGRRPRRNLTTRTEHGGRGGNGAARILWDVHEIKRKNISTMGTLHLLTNVFY